KKSNSMDQTNTSDEYLKRLKELEDKIKEASLRSGCPSCGYCPSCGRRNTTFRPFDEGFYPRCRWDTNTSF
ncbi:MAG TPA: hypothetical protein VD994_18070, partial [Prosthecobacter sp.]|nr:hypothetical protein [Prosthecobacter sp.]